MTRIAADAESKFLSLSLSWVLRCWLIGIALFVSYNTFARQSTFVAFESGPVRPLALSEGGRLLYAVNTPDNRLEIFTVGEGSLQPLGSVPVGMEPVAVAVRAKDEVWVVNKISDSVSIVKRDSQGIRVVRTLAVGDEPQDIVFAGPNRKFAFISSARRDYDRPISNPVGNADVWVFDADEAIASPNARPIKRINLFTDIPRGLAVSPDGSRVYAAAFASGNKTSAVSDFDVGGNILPPFDNADGVTAPATALMARFENGRWLDAADRDWSNKIPFEITDHDLFVIDASQEEPMLIDQIDSIGTTLFNVAVNPVSGEVYVSNLDARNTVRFEGPGGHGGSTVRGDIARNRITIVDGASVEPRHLNKHIDFELELGTQEENDASLAFPLEMAVSSNGATLYVAAYGSAKIGVFDTEKLRQDTFVPSPDSHIELWGGGPGGIVLDEDREQAYVLTRFNNSVAVIDLATNTQIAEVALFNPEPPSIVMGRPFLYDARSTSSRGNAACATCHIFGDKDELAWNLGDPDGGVLPNPNPFVIDPLPGSDIAFHPMKGPMTTQSLRGLANHGPMHWRGDRTGGNDPESLDPLDEAAAFKAFNVAFEGLVGRAGPLTDQEMQRFTNFALQLVYPPNPLRPKDNSLTPEAERGREFYFNFPTLEGTPCNGCHTISVEEGFFGTNGNSINIRRPQVMKIPHIRNAYTKVGILRNDLEIGPIQFKGFAYGHAGTTLSVRDLLGRQDEERFDFPGGAPQRRDVAHWVLSVDSNLAPIVGYQVTLGANSGPDVLRNISVMINRAQVVSPRRECNLIAKGQLNNVPRGWVLNRDGTFTSDSSGQDPFTLESLVAQSKTPGQELTFTCAPSGSGIRMGIDRDEDGVRDFDERSLMSSAQVAGADAK